MITPHKIRPEVVERFQREVIRFYRIQGREFYWRTETLKSFRVPGTFRCVHRIRVPLSVAHIFAHTSGSFAKTDLAASFFMHEMSLDSAESLPNTAEVRPRSDHNRYVQIRPGRLFSCRLLFAFGGHLRQPGCEKNRRTNQSNFSPKPAIMSV